MTLAPPYERIVFDCDSTLSHIEGIDVLCQNSDPSVAAAVEALTNQAMAGDIPLEDVYGKRLELCSPRQVDVMKVGSLYVQKAVPGGKELISGLRSLGKDIVIVSGGLQLAVVSFATWLGLRDQAVHAVKVLFEADGTFHDYDRDSPLARNGGKSEVLAALPPARTVVVGDGVTDAETRDVVDAFICFSGVVHRQEAADRADAVLATPSLAPLIDLVCTPDERDRLARDPRHRQLLAMAGRAKQT